MEREHTCCFTGCRKLPNDKIEAAVRRLDYTVESLIAHGVRRFISGGTLGFDMIAASLIIAKKEMGKGIQLVFALPYRNQEEKWDVKQKKLYYDVLAEANEVIYVSEEYHDGCIGKRNRYMVDHSAYCVCAILHSKYDTDRTVRYANKRGIKVISVVR